MDKWGLQVAQCRGCKGWFVLWLSCPCASSWADSGQPHREALVWDQREQVSALAVSLYISSHVNISATCWFHRISFQVPLAQLVTVSLINRLIGFIFGQQASAGEIPANRGHPGVPAGQRGRAWTADGGGGDDHSSWKATAGVLTASYQ